MAMAIKLLVHSEMKKQEHSKLFTKFNLVNLEVYPSKIVPFFVDGGWESLKVLSFKK